MLASVTFLQKVYLFILVCMYDVCMESTHEQKLEKNIVCLVLSFHPFGGSGS